MVFTDVVRSTEHAAELGDRRWREILENHYRVLRETVERHYGRIVNTTGDGVLATFDSPGRAIRSACAMTAGLPSSGLDVRAGVHTGEVEVTARDLAGIGVHIAARVQALAGPGEVMVSRTVVDLVAGSGIVFEPRGEHVLKGVPGMWDVYLVNSGAGR